jgi:hypothetical protein
MITAAPIRDIVSLPRLAVTLQALPARVRAAAAEIGVEPVMSIDDNPHYAAADVEKIAEALADRR